MRGSVLSDSMGWKVMGTDDAKEANRGATFQARELALPS